MSATAANQPAPWRRLHNPVVRDLAWAGFAAPLVEVAGLQGPPLELSPHWIELLAELDRNPSALLEFLGDRPQGRLGLYYEALWHFLLRRDPTVELVLHNLPVRDGGRTLGEFDCIYYCHRRRRHIHLELAVKFYLGVADEGYWLGPGRRDRLDLKLSHLRLHQCRLGAVPGARRLLAEHGIDVVYPELDLKGYLFQGGQRTLPPPGYNSGAGFCRWYTLDQFAALPALPPHWLGWHWLPRRRWLSPYRCSPGGRHPFAAVVDELTQHFRQDRRPQLLAACDERGEEQQRCFVTDMRWPQ